MTEKEFEEIIDIVKADKIQSMIEYKNRLAFQLGIYKSDYEELKTMVDEKDDIQMALLITIEDILKTVQKAGIPV